MYSNTTNLEDRIFEGLQNTLSDCAEIFEDNKQHKRETAEWREARDYVLGLRRAIYNTRQSIEDPQSERLLEQVCWDYSELLRKKYSRIKEEISEREGSHPLGIFFLLGYLGSLVTFMGSIYYIMRGDIKSAIASFSFTGLTFAGSLYIRRIVRSRTNVYGLIDNLKAIKECSDVLKDKDIMKNVIYKRYSEIERLMPEII